MKTNEAKQSYLVVIGSSRRDARTHADSEGLPKPRVYLGTQDDPNRALLGLRITSGVVTPNARGLVATEMLHCLWKTMMASNGLSATVGSHNLLDLKKDAREQ